MCLQVQFYVIDICLLVTVSANFEEYYQNCLAGYETAYKSLKTTPLPQKTVHIRYPPPRVKFCTPQKLVLYRYARIYRTYSQWNIIIWKLGYERYC